MRKLPSLNALKAFEATARLSSITQAADELGVSHSSVSQQIKQLELYFGQKLFLRKGRGVEPSVAALVFLDDIRYCFDRIASSSEQLASRGKNRTIKVNATPSFLMKWLIPRSSIFQLSHPNLSLEISASYQDGVSHLAEPFDVIFRRRPVSKPDYVCRRVLPDVSTPVMSPELQAAARPETAAALTQLPLLHMRSRPEAWSTWFKAHGVAGRENVVGPSFDHFFLSLQAAINGLGVAMGPLALIEDDVRSNRLVAPFPELTIEGPGFFAIYRKSLLRESLGRVFLKWLSEETGTDLS